MSLVDTHAHIHDSKYKFKTDQVLTDARGAGVNTIVCVGTDAKDSRQAINFAREHEECYATVGLHPHEAKLGSSALEQLTELMAQPKVVGVGECGLDYFYKHSPAQDQKAALEFQIEMAQVGGKPLVFHVRDAFDDFFKVIDKFKNVRGVIHSFSSTVENLEQALKRGLYVALNGIMTFTKDAAQLEAAKAVPLNRLLLETDSPYLTPTPLRGKPNQPANTKMIAEFLADLRGETLEEIAGATTHNAHRLFKLENHAQN